LSITAIASTVLNYANVIAVECTVLYTSTKHEGLRAELARVLYHTE